jgi:CcmD family protein
VSSEERIRQLEEQVRHLNQQLDDRIAAEKYLAAAYAVVLVVLLAYFLIHSAKVARLQRELEDFTTRFANRIANPT